MRGAKVKKCCSRQELNAMAEFAMVDSTPIRFYIRSAEQLLKQAEIYRVEGDLQTSYIFYMRYCNLVITLLPKHREYFDPEQKVALIKLKKGADVAMTEIGRLKPILDKRYNEYQEYIRHLEMITSAQARSTQGFNPQSQDVQPQFDNKEDKEHQEHRWANTSPTPGWSLAKALEGVPGTNSSQLTQQSHQYQHHNNFELTSEIQYPEYQRHKNHTRPVISTPSIRAQPLIPIPTSTPPALPRKPVINNAPKLPPKIPLDEDVHEFSQGLRTLIVPVRLLDRFLNIVRPNTIKNLETCGILAGVLSRNKLTVTTLIIPKQTATSDTCSTTNEDELFEFQSERDLMTLGWIHTHPTQTCFMSSVDLHTHCSYQLMLPEAIAIVCAPKHDKEYESFAAVLPLKNEEMYFSVPAVYKHSLFHKAMASLD
ncbi:AMSH-like protease [Mortierella sp. AD011]|nr:AMSH-like protease [Mortierella sp. AD010]KAF9379525.1 AMSH-like protease [Mortierella sp. AD011]